MVLSLCSSCLSTHKTGLGHGMFDQGYVWTLGDIPPRQDLGTHQTRLVHRMCAQDLVWAALGRVPMRQGSGYSPGRTGAQGGKPGVWMFNSFINTQ